MAFYYTPFEFCCALRGKLHDYMFQRTDAARWLFLDSDLFILHSLEEAWRYLEGTSILLSPQSSTPAPAGQTAEIELRFLRYGSYNAGFLGLRRTEEASRFVSWFKERLERCALFDLSVPLFTDQLWLNLVPLYFKEVALFDHPGANVAYWNLFGKKIGRGPEGWRADGKPLLFYHFSAWSPAQPGQVSKWHASAPAPPFWGELAGDYRRRLLAQGWEATAGLAYAFGCFENGERVTDGMRRLYHRDVLEGRPGDCSPFKRWEEFRQRIEASG